MREQQRAKAAQKDRGTVNAVSTGRDSVGPADVFFNRGLSMIARSDHGRENLGAHQN
jgi:hypothetical protein